MSFLQFKQAMLLQMPEQTVTLLKCLFLEAGYLYTVKLHKLWTRLDTILTENQIKEGSRNIPASLVLFSSLPGWNGQNTNPSISDLV